MGPIRSFWVRLACFGRDRFHAGSADPMYSFVGSGAQIMAHRSGFFLLNRAQKQHSFEAAVLVALAHNRLKDLLYAP